MKMLKPLFIAALLLGSVAFVQSEMVNSPTGPSQALATADYGGVDYSTSAFHTSHTTVTAKRSLVYGAVFSSGTVTDYVEVWDATSTVNTLGVSPIRFYNVSGSSSPATPGGITSGFSGLDKPVRFKKGIIWRASSAAYNSIYLMFFVNQ